VPGQKNVYVDGINGKDWKKGGFDGSETKPWETIQFAVDQRETCTTINVKAGTYTNKGYTGDPAQTSWSPVVDLDGVSDLIIRNYQNDKVVMKFDGPGGFVGGSKNDPAKLVKDVEIYGFEIQGPNQDITYVDAFADRLIGSKYYTGRGIAIWKGQRIHIHDMFVHDCPASGLRVDNSDYVVIEDSEVFNNTWWSTAAESAVVLAQSINIDDENTIKMILRNNTVYNNMNKIPYYNKAYNWDYSPIAGNIDCAVQACEDKLLTCPWQCRYGKDTQDYIVDGMGVYVTRNSDTYLKGQMEMSSNTCYGNGINGLVFHRTFRGVVKDNLIYDNGVVPKDGHPEAVVEDWMAPLRKTRQPYSGLVLNNAKGVRMFRNKVRARYADDYAFTMEIDAGADYDLNDGGNNKVCRGEVGAKLASVVSTGSESDCTLGFP
jgi:hypothetical protein